MLFLLYSPSVEAVGGYCNITSTTDLSQHVNPNQQFSLGFLKLSFQQSSGATVQTIARRLPEEIERGSATTTTPITLDRICIFEYIIDTVPHIKVVILPDFNAVQPTPSGQITPVTDETTIQNQIWAAIQNDSSWVYTDSIYLKNVDLPTSQRSTTLLRLSYCKFYTSLQDSASGECPVDPDDVVNFDESLETTAWLLFMGAILLTIISTVAFGFLYHRYERQADFKHQQAINKTIKMRQNVNTTPQEVYDQRVYDHQVAATV